MQLQHQKIALDVNDTRAYTVLNAHQGDSKTRFIDITLTENGNTITLSSNYVATVKASINNKTKAVNTAVVNSAKNDITVELTKTMLDTPGLLNCEVILQEGQQFVTSATFTVKVAESVISDESAIVASREFGKLLDALTEIKDIEDKADRVQTLVDNIDKLKSANDIINRLSTSETNIEANKAAIRELSELVQVVKDSAIAEIESLKADKLDKTDFNSYKTNNDNAVNSKVDTTDFNNYKTATDKAIADNTKSIKANVTAIDKCITDTASNSALINQNAIKVTTDKSTSIVLNDSSDSNIVNIKLYNTQANLYMCGKNFADFNTYFKKAEPWDRDTNKSKIVVTKDAINKTITFNSVNDTDRSGINVFWKDSGIPFSYLTNKTITVSVDVSSTDDCKFFLCNSCDNYKNISVNTTANKVSRVVLTTKMPSDVSSIKDTSILLHVDSSKTTVTLSNFQIEVNNTATDYEDYKGSQTITNDTDLSTVHTYYPTTTVICDSDFVLTYVADPKIYIDNKFNELATAIVAHESEVM